MTPKLMKRTFFDDIKEVKKAGESPNISNGCIALFVFVLFNYI